MLSDTEIKVKGFNILAKYLGELETERFISLLQREKFDYTKWRNENLEDEGSIEEISKKAMDLRNKNQI